MQAVLSCGHLTEPLTRTHVHASAGQPASQPANHCPYLSHFRFSRDWPPIVCGQPVAHGSAIWRRVTPDTCRSVQSSIVGPGGGGGEEEEEGGGGHGGEKGGTSDGARL
ncbi:hypothetical protein C0Q70_10948 [Pomacea canaliculata]|uniref:Uncharacterized protein n=1 Tax=Pomacea canaliculata TaxID=400727 RepID=A0A2T7P4M8_POMCA|nr:hypothetical protein C0Q70_10948 [Pomacea canaliculata]